MNFQMNFHCKMLLLVITAILKVEPIIGSGNLYAPYRQPHPETFYDGNGPPLRYPQADDSLWSQFWDVYDYSGPLEQEPIDTTFFQPDDSFYQSRLPQVDHDDVYNRYRDYFFSKYGTNFIE